MQEPEIKALLRKYIDNQCSLKELAFVLKYIQLPEGKQALEDVFLEEWDAFEPHKAKEGLAERWFGLLDNKTKNNTTRTFTIRNSWLKYAAIFIMITGIGARFLLRKPQIETASQVVMIEKVNPRGQRTQITLQDSSIVYLGPDSRLRYPEKLNGRTRELYLEGEAFFEVKHDGKRPFIVHTGNVRTQVLGTSFKIEAFKNQELSVAVATGKVSVGYEAPNHQLKSLAVLTPGEKVSWNRVSNQSKKTTLSIADVKSWKDGNLAFTDARLAEISHQLERWYNTKIIIKGAKINAYSLSIGINGKAPVTAALDAITSATGLTYKINQNQITLTAK